MINLTKPYKCTNTISFTPRPVPGAVLAPRAPAEPGATPVTPWHRTGATPDLVPVPTIEVGHLVPPAPASSAREHSGSPSSQTRAAVQHRGACSWPHVKPRGRVSGPSPWGKSPLEMVCGSPPRCTTLSDGAAQLSELCATLLCAAWSSSKCFTSPRAFICLPSYSV